MRQSLANARRTPRIEQMTPLLQRALRLMLLLPALLAAPQLLFAATEVRDVRMWTAPDNTRVVFDLSAAVEYRLFRLHNPERIVLDLEKSTLTARDFSLAIPDPVLHGMRIGMQEGGVLRIVLEVKEGTNPRSFLLKPMQQKPFRLVLDLPRAEGETPALPAAPAPAVAANPLPLPVPPPAPTLPAPIPPTVHSGAPLVIAVDAGHGGEDPGAIGADGLQEKAVTLAVARLLAEEINKRPGMSAVLVRKGDYFIPLRQRVAIARKAKADLMISIHADAAKNRNAMGASVYTLAESGATPDRVAAALAQRENAADEIGGDSGEMVDDPLVNSILGDMAKRDSLNSSYILAEGILRRIDGVGPIKYDTPKRARFAVLTALERPSVLVELDYISNPEREKMLADAAHQQKLARQLMLASEDFLRKQGRLGGDNAVADARGSHRR